MSVWSGDCKLSIEAKAKVGQVPSAVEKNVMWEGIVIAVRPVVTDCTQSHIAKLLSASASLDDVVEKALSGIPTEKRQSLREFLVLPQVSLSPVL